MSFSVANRVKNFKISSNATCSVFCPQSNIQCTGWFTRSKSGKLYLISVYHIYTLNIKESYNDVINRNVYALVDNVNGTNENGIFELIPVFSDLFGDITVFKIKNEAGENNNFTENWPIHTTFEIFNSTPEIGEEISMIGFPINIDYNSVSYGYIRDNNVQSSNFPPFMFFDISIHGGNSGSPIINSDMKIVSMLGKGFVSSNKFSETFCAGLRTNLLKFIIDDMTLKFESDNLYYQKYIKNWMIASFLVLTPSSLYSLGSLAFSRYLNGKRNFSGIINQTTSKIIIKIEYIHYLKGKQTIELSSIINDNNNIWEYAYFSKPHTTIKIYEYNYNNNSIEESIMPLINMPENLDIPPALK